MNILIISTNRNMLPMPVLPLGACLVAEAAEHAGHKVKVLDLMFERDIRTSIKNELAGLRPDIIGLSVRNIDNNDYQNPVFYAEEIPFIIETIRSVTQSPVILGGAAISVMPEELLRYTGASWAVIGDGETVFPELLEKLSRNEPPVDVPGVAWVENDSFVANPLRSNGDCHDFRIPDFGRWINLRKYLSGFSAIPVQTKLGCHFQCIYCTYRKIEGNTYRLCSPESVANTLNIFARRGLKDIEFVDNVFNYPYHHAMDICREIINARPGVRLQSLEMNPLFIDDELINAMEKAGFTGIGITVESASDNVLKGLQKGFGIEDVYRAAHVVQRHSLPCVWIFMFGGPGETENTVRETLRFAESFIRPEDTAFFSAGIRIYPGTKLESIAREEGILSLHSHEMLSPVFYCSPTVDYSWMKKKIQEALNSHMNFIDSGSIGMSLLTPIHRYGYKLGVRPPLWRYTRHIRRGLRFLGMDV